MGKEAGSGVAAVNRRVVSCTLCPRLVRHREATARARRAAFRDWDYWGRPVPGFGDEKARLMVVGLAPAAHGGNRTGRMFTGDRSGDTLYGTLHRAGFASQPASTSRDDGMSLRGCYITAAARCAPPDNNPTPREFANCRRYLVEEVEALSRLRVVVVLGQLAMREFLLAWATAGHAVPRPRPKFAHGAEFGLGKLRVLVSYHPSQRNTQTGLLTEKMLDAVFHRAREIADG